MINLDNLPGSLPDEKLIAVYRRHDLTLAYIVITTLVLLFSPVLIYGLIQAKIITIPSNPTNYVIILLVVSSLYLFGFLFVFQQFIDHWLDIWIVTSRRIINIEQQGLFSRVRSEVRLYRVQDVTSEIHGLVRSLFNFGIVYVQTAGEKERFAFEDVPDPKTIAKKIMFLAERDQHVHEQEITASLEDNPYHQHTYQSP